MGKASRTKGARGELTVAHELSKALGTTLSRRVRQHDGDSDLLGLPGWSIEVKHHKQHTRTNLTSWWQQALDQTPAGERTALAYHRHRGWWRFLWAPQQPLGRTSFTDTVEADLPAFIRAIQDCLP